MKFHLELKNFFKNYDKSFEVARMLILFLLFQWFCEIHSSSISFVIILDIAATCAPDHST